MQLAFCLFRYYSYGGLERDFFRIARECAHRGHDINIYTMAWEGKIPDGFSVNILPVKGLTNHARCWAFSRQFDQIIKKNNFDLSIGFNRMPYLDVYYAADVCYVASAQQKHGFWYRCMPRYKIYSLLERSVFKQSSSTKILLLNPAEQQKFSHYYQTPADRFYLLPPGIDSININSSSSMTHKLKLRQHLGLDVHHKIILMVGSDFKRKGVDRALLALTTLPHDILQKTTLCILGRGKVKPMLALAKKLKIEKQVLFFGERDDVNDFMIAADILLHPAYQETAGMVLLEAMVAGLPVLVTENCGYAHYIAKAEAGITLPMPFVQQKLNEQLYKILISPELQQRYSENARIYFKTTNLHQFSEHVVNLLESFYEEKQKSMREALV